MDESATNGRRNEENGYHDARHEEGISDLYDIIGGWEERRAEQSFDTQWYEKESIEEIE